MSAKSAAPGVEHRGAAEATNRERRILDSRARRAQARAVIAVAWRQLTAIAVKMLPALEEEARKRQIAAGVNGSDGGRGHEKPLAQGCAKGLARAPKASEHAAKIVGERISAHACAHKNLPGSARVGAKAVIRLRPPRRGVEHVSVILDRIWWQLLLRWETSRLRQ